MTSPSQVKRPCTVMREGYLSQLATRAAPCSLPQAWTRSGLICRKARRMSRVSSQNIVEARVPSRYFKRWKVTPFLWKEKLRAMFLRRRMTWILSNGFCSNSVNSTISQVAGCWRGRQRRGSGISASHSIGKSDIQATVNGLVVDALRLGRECLLAGAA